MMGVQCSAAQIQQMRQRGSMRSSKARPVGHGAGRQQHQQEQHRRGVVGSGGARVLGLTGLVVIVALTLLAVASHARHVEVAVAADGSSVAAVGLQVEPQLVLATVNPNVVNAEYAVRGEILIRAMELEAQLKASPGSLPFQKLVRCNIGNPMALGQKPISFTREVLSLVLNPAWIGKIDAPSDVVARAKKYLAAIPSVGAYSESQGVEVVRKEVAAFIEKRDGVKLGNVSVGDIFLTDGASQAVESLLSLLIRSPDDMLLVPIPQYPLYSALTAMLNGHFEGFEMTEEGGWGIDVKSLEKVLENAQAKGKIPRAMVVINPGNPTGSTLSKERMVEILEFCARRRLVLLADEVYQENVYRPDVTPFISFRKVLLEEMLQSEEKRQQYRYFQLASFHSTSKGVVGECGLRGGYVQLDGFDKDVKAQLYKLASVKLCSNVPGQLAIGLMVNPPIPGDESYPLYKAETGEIFSSLKRRAEKLHKALNSMKGITCNPLEGAMYAFPSIHLPSSFLDLATKLGKMPDTLYALRLLEATGIVVVPGSGFGQRSGTWHIRTTFLPPEHEMDDVLSRFAAFQTSFHNEFQ